MDVSHAHWVAQRTLRLGDHNWSFKQPFFTSQNFCSLSLKTSMLPADTTLSSSELQRLITLCEKKNFLVFVWNLLFNFRECPLVLPEASSSKKDSNDMADSPFDILNSSIRSARLLSLFQSHQPQPLQPFLIIRDFVNCYFITTYFQKLGQVG